MCDVIRVEEWLANARASCPNINRAERRYGPIPSFQAVKSIVLASQYGIEKGVDEACWDRQVHFRLLSLALRRPLDSIKGGPVNFTPSTAAAIHTGFMKGALSRMVDFCVCIDSDVVGDQDPAISSAINNVREASGYASVNHTSHFHRNKPISLSIESKQRNASRDDAHLQIGVWHSAQWTYFDRLAQKRGVTRESLPFLPGLIVQAQQPGEGMGLFLLCAVSGLVAASTCWLQQKTNQIGD
ncbi:hypothetical protein LX36DRAFT_705281 [Colletotrichum falcatum]|nr:hypothetical protein LX36DRAFT_705281 [Colletotrichum falcatum]